MVVGLAGCGWQLQGSGRLPATMQVIYVDTNDAYSDFYRELRSTLMAAGAQVKPQGTGVAAILHVKTDETAQRVLSVSSRNRPEQYVVYYRVAYSVDLSGAEVLPNQQLELSATYSYDSDTVLAKQREQLTMQRALARELAGHVLRRLASLSAEAAHSPTASDKSVAGS
jgi:LPS-assembly lipoprotein